MQQSLHQLSTMWIKRKRHIKSQISKPKLLLVLIFDLNRFAELSNLDGRFRDSNSNANVNANVKANGENKIKKPMPRQQPRTLSPNFLYECYSLSTEPQRTLLKE